MAAKILRIVLWVVGIPAWLIVIMLVTNAFVMDGKHREQRDKLWQMMQESDASLLFITNSKEEYEDWLKYKEEEDLKINNDAINVPLVELDEVIAGIPYNVNSIMFMCYQRGKTYVSEFVSLAAIKDEVTLRCGNNFDGVFYITYFVDKGKSL